MNEETQRQMNSLMENIQKYVQEILKLHKDRERLIGDLQYFVDRVEAGTIHSQTTYARYKATLEHVTREASSG